MKVTFLTTREDRVGIDPLNTSPCVVRGYFKWGGPSDETEKKKHQRSRVTVGVVR
jgi:hypothetical protein